MFEQLFSGLFDLGNTQVITPGKFLLCLGCPFADI